MVQFLLIFSLAASCCPTQKHAKQPAAKEALPDRNIRDPKLENTPPNLELMDTSDTQNSDKAGDQRVPGTLTISNILVGSPIPPIIRLLASVATGSTDLGALVTG